jgi:hypothetical protein
MEEYVVKLENNEQEEAFESNSDNILRVKVKSDVGYDITGRVYLEMSKNALLGLGTELIRLAHKFEDGLHTHLYPIDEGLITQKLGVYVLPDSSELVISCTEFKAIDEYIKNC